MPNRKSRQLYMDVASKANVPLQKRERIALGRNDVHKEPRRYHLMVEEQVRLKKEASEKGKFISPYGSGRLYSFIVEALVSLGGGKPHAVGLVFGKFKELSSAESTKDLAGMTLWDRFSKKVPRNKSTARDPLGKFMQNVEVLQRLGGNHPYGFKLAQLGSCIDILVDGQRGVKIQLRTGIPVGDPVKPINLNRKRNYTKTVDQVPSGLIIKSEDGTEVQAEVGKEVSAN